ncbi:MAG: twin-arginine translocation pathway signal [Deltaproteobacteria bacterium]|nr:twin-arginine translocation pathway signal [Deltaproteobacteria bacterium]
MFTIPHQAAAASAAEINQNAKTILEKLYAKTDSARALGQNAKAILVFPSITKAGFIVGGQYGEGVLLKEGKPAGYYNTVSASYGLQAGVQKFGYVLFFMTDAALRYLDRSDGWELGTGPSVVIVDTGTAKSLTTTTAKSDVYAFFFDQRGLMAGVGLQGTKITKIEK